MGARSDAIRAQHQGDLHPDHISHAPGGEGGGGAKDSFEHVHTTCGAVKAHQRRFQTLFEIDATFNHTSIYIWRGEGGEGASPSIQNSSRSKAEAF